MGDMGMQKKTSLIKGASKIVAKKIPGSRAVSNNDLVQFPVLKNASQNRKKLTLKQGLI